MSWKRHFRIIKNQPQAVPHPLDANRYGGGSSTSSNFASYLPLVYAGHPNRIQRYFQFEDMDRDSDINAALDTIADFCTQSEEQTEEPFDMQFNGEPNESETKILKTMLEKWVKLNDFRSRLFYMFRDTLKFGDSFHLRDPETQEWLWLDHFMVEMVKVDEEQAGNKKPDEYLIRGLDYNRQARYATKKADPNQYRTPYGTSNVGASRVSAVSGASAGPAAFSLAGGAVDPRVRQGMGIAQDLSVIDANNVIHLSLSIGNDINWPFGASILEPIFKTYKQKELLEDAIIIYRVQRAPERRIFYIDTGTMPPERAKRHIEGIKNDIHQRRIPNRTGSGGCFDMATRVPLLDGRTLSITELAAEYAAGKVNWTYSCDPATGAIAPGRITWAGITRRDAQVVKLTLDNGETIVCTDDHNYPILNRGKTAAKDIEIDVDSLVSFNTRLFSINERNDTAPQYQQVYDHATKEWRFTHRVVGSFMKAAGRHNELGLADRKTIIHHGDFNKYNNTPENLFHMNGYDHFLLHAEAAPRYLESLTEEERAALIAKRSEGSLRSWAKAKPERLLATTALFMQNCAEQQQKPWANQANLWNHRLFEILVETLKANRGGKRETAKALSANEEFMALYRDLNQPTGRTIVHLTFEKLSVTTLEKLIKNYGYSGWREFLHDCGFQVRKPTLGLKTNHQLLSAIVEMAKSMDVPNLADVCNRLTADADFMSLFTALNASTKGMSNKDKISINTMKVLIGKHGFKDWTDFRQKLSCFNHKVVAIEYLDTKMDVGTLTIDGSEEYHDFHTFALEQGVFAFNSMLDAAYNPLCLDLTTRIPLLDGRTLTLSELIEEHQSGKENWVHSCDPMTGEIMPGIISWAGVTRKDAEVIRLTLNTGKTFTSTPDHKVPVLGKGEVEAQHLTPDDTLIAFPSGQVRLEMIEKIGRMDVGTITVDGNEQWHCHHTFAIESGIFIKNSINDDYFFAQGIDGRGSKVETLPGGELVGELGDLLFFSRKLARGLRVPLSYLNLGENEGSNVMFNDGKLGAAMIQEFRFSKFCVRLQSLLAPVFDKEFKKYLIRNGIEIEWSLFDLQFSPPQSFTRYRQIELDSQRVQVYSGVAENKYLAQRFKLKRYLGLSEDEIIENETMWKEENASKLKKKVGETPAETESGAGLGDVGLHPGGGEMPDMEMPPDGSNPEEVDIAGGPPPVGGAAGAGMPPPAAGGAMGGAMPPV